MNTSPPHPGKKFWTIWNRRCRSLVYIENWAADPISVKTHEVFATFWKGRRENICISISISISIWKLLWTTQVHMDFQILLSWSPPLSFPKGFISGWFAGLPIKNIYKLGLVVFIALIYQCIPAFEAWYNWECSHCESEGYIGPLLARFLKQT